MHLQRRLLTYITLSSFSIILAVAQDGSHRCDLPLGLSGGKIPDSAIQSSVGNGTTKARLNSDGAWCFNGPAASGQMVTLTFDLGSRTFVSGFQTQGPPLNMKGTEYNYHVGFYVENSTDVNSTKWDICCGGKARLFYAEDTIDKSDVVKLHAFGMLVLASKLRFRFETSIRWAGDADKCFRVELIGCTLDLSPKTNLQIKPLPSGWVEATWDRPLVIMPNTTLSDRYYLPVGFYKANLTWVENISENNQLTNSSELTVEAPRVMVPGPIWGANYSIVLTCPHQGIRLPCGNGSIIATVHGCDSSVSICTAQDEVIFRRPQKMKAWIVRPTTSADPSSTVFVSWIAEGPGWVTTSTRIRVIDDKKNEVVNRIIEEGDHYILLENLVGPDFDLTFTPQASNLNVSPSFHYDLYVIEWNSLNETSQRNGFGAFVTDVTLEVNIHWEGKMIVTWSPALVREGDLGITYKEDNTSKLEIDTNTEFTGQANIYNVSLMETDYIPSLRVKSVSGMEVLRAEFPLLKLETRYQINISCDYGGIVVQCGFSTKYTELPVTLLELNSQLLVYVSRASGEQWRRQENSCNKSSGSLVSFGTEEEELILRPHFIGNPKVSFNSFWMGLNMCPGNTGSLWSDQSQWSYNLLPEVDSGLSSATCCIKAQLVPDAKRFVWLGEACNALLPGICEFKPRGLVGDIANLTRRNATQTTASYQWDYTEKYWNPSTFVGSVCPTMDLTTFQPIQKSCTKTKIRTSKRDFESRDLSIFTEFNLSVSAALTALDYYGPNQTIKLRTFPPEPVFLTVRGTGHLNVMWAQKVAEFGENDSVDVLVEEGQNFTHFVRTTVPAKNLTIGKLTLGELYRITLNETTGRKRQEIREFYAYPPCDCAGCQDQTRCIFPSDKQVPKSLALAQCNSENATLTVSTTRQRLDVLLRQAEKVLDDLWVSSSSLKGNGMPRNISNILMRDVDAAESTTSAPQDQESTSAECLLVSRSQRAIIVAADCRESHYAACEQKAPLSSIFPTSFSEFDKRIGGTWYGLNWKSVSGWKANYTMYYRRRAELRYKRDIKYLNFDSPPVVINNLKKNTDYAVELVADLGKGYLSASPEFIITTSDSNTRSGEISETASLSQGGSPTWMSAGWAPSPEFYLANLICGALLIVACVSTMLLFFATGMFYQDCVAQLGFLFCLFLAYLLLLVAHPQYVTTNENGCVVLSAVLHLLFLSAFTYLALEALTMSHLLVEKIKSPFEKSNWALGLVGVIVPFVYVCIAAGVIQIGYPYVSRHTCWVNIYGPVLYVEAVPNGLLLLITVTLLLATVKSNEDTQPILKDTDIRGRQCDSYKLRWIILALALELGVTWSSGVAAYHTHTPEAHAVFNAFTLIMAITIIFARTWLDDTFRSKIYRLCCGTELTYKRSAMRSISARTRIYPTQKDGRNVERRGIRPRVSFRPHPHTSVSRAQSVQSTDKTATSAWNDYCISSRFSTTTVRASQKSATLPSYNLPNTPPMDDQKNNSSVLIKRTYKFDD